MSLMKKLLTALLAAALIISCVGCGNNAEIEALKKENEELKAQLKESNNTQAVSPTQNVSTKKAEEYISDLVENSKYTQTDQEHGAEE